jgi:hypothetical protein
MFYTMGAGMLIVYSVNFIGTFVSKQFEEMDRDIVSLSFVQLYPSHGLVPNIHHDLIGSIRMSGLLGSQTHRFQQVRIMQPYTYSLGNITWFLTVISVTFFQDYIDITCLLPWQKTVKVEKVND